MPFAKLAVSITLTIILVIPILLVSSSLSPTMHVKASVSLLPPLSYAEITGVVRGAGMQHGVAYIEAIKNNISSSALPSVNPVQGTLIVTEKVVNEGGGNNKKPSDFTITVHGNNPSPSFFPGSSAGTAVKLQMGMYSVTEAGPPGYNSTLSGDCSGGMMSVETKNCTITNMLLQR
jgi:hypothetical protein